VFKILPYEPKEEWDSHGIPVKIQFDDGDERVESPGSLYLDIPNKPLQFPCYAFFIDPANALVLSTCPGPPATALGKIPGDWSQRDDLPLVTSGDVRRHIQEFPKVIGLNYTRDVKYEAFASTKRIGVASFVKRTEPDPREGGEKGKEILDSLDELNPDDIFQQSGSESWGPITKEDPRVRVTII
jgi:hypothetical protein